MSESMEMSPRKMHYMQILYCVKPPPYHRHLCLNVLLPSEKWILFQWLIKVKLSAALTPLWGFTLWLDQCYWLPLTACVDAKFRGLIHRFKNLRGKASSATHSMQLAKHNNAMWRVISNGDQPLPHLLQRHDLKYQESQFRTKKAAVSPGKDLCNI